MNPINKRNYYAMLNGLTRKFEVFEGGEQKRGENARDVWFVGSFQATKLHDPGHTVGDITGRIICTKDDPFIDEVSNLYRQHLENPESAGSFILVAENDNNSVLGRKTYTRAVLQSVKPPQGDKNSSDMVYVEIVCSPESAIAAAA